MSRIHVDERALAEHIQNMDQMVADMGRGCQSCAQDYSQDRNLYQRIASEIEQRMVAYRREADMAESEMRNADEENREAAQNAQQRYMMYTQKLQELRSVERRIQEVWGGFGEDVGRSISAMENNIRDVNALWRGGRAGLSEYLDILTRGNTALAPGSAAGAVSHTEQSGKSRGRPPSYIMHQSVKTAPDGKKILSLSIGGSPFETVLSKSGAAAAYRKAVACNDTEMIARCRAIFEVETIRQTLDLQNTPSGVMQLGGYHKEVKGRPGYESHHIPQQGAQAVNANYLPTIALLDEDHKLTDSYGGKSSKAYQPLFSSVKENTTYKQRVQSQIAGDQYMHVVYCELLNLKDQFGDKYNAGISQYLDSLADMLGTRGIPSAKEQPPSAQT